jgi:hypothetical protein
MAKTRPFKMNNCYLSIKQQLLSIHVDDRKANGEERERERERDKKT